MSSPLSLGVWLEAAAVLAVGTIVAVVVAALVARCVRPASPASGSAAWRRLIWQAAVLGMLVLVMIELTGLGQCVVHSLRKRGQEHFYAEPPPGPSGKKAPDPFVAGDEAGVADGAGPAAAAPQPPHETDREGPPEADAPGPAQTGREGVLPTAWAVRIGWWPGLVWLIGAILVVGRAAGARLVMAALCRRRALEPDAGWQRRVRSLARALGLRRRVRLIELGRLPGPIAFGVLRPTVAVPGGFAEDLDAASQEAVLLHELAHLAGHDALWGLLADLAAAVLWWHPAAWWARRQLASACETAADEASLVVADGPVLLAKCLVDLGKRFSLPRAVAWGPIRGMGLRSGLSRRVERLLQLERKRGQASFCRDGPQGASHKKMPVPFSSRFAAGIARAIGPVVLLCLVLLSTAWARSEPTGQGGPTMETIRSSWRHSIARAAILAAVSLGHDAAPARQKAAPAQNLPEETKTPPEQLRRQSRDLRLMADELALQARDLGAQSWDMSRQAEALERQARLFRRRAEQATDPQQRKEELRRAEQAERRAAQSARHAEQSAKDADGSARAAEEAARRAEELTRQAAALERKAGRAASRPSKPAAPATKPSRRDLPAQPKVVHLKQADARLVADAISRLLEARGIRPTKDWPIQLVADERTNSIVVSASPKMREIVAKLITKLDTPANRLKPGQQYVPLKYVKDLAAFFAEVDRGYPFFQLKGIGKDWAATKQRLSAKVKACRSDTEFLGILIEAGRCLRDAHLGIRETKAKFPARPAEYYPGISFLPATKNRVVVMYPPKGHEKVLKTGTVVTQIDGKDARSVLEERARKAWAAGGFFSSPQRARLFEYRIPLRGKQRRRHTITYLAGEAKRQVVLTADVEPRGWPHTYNLPANLTRVGRSFWYTKLAGGAGYMYLRRVDDSTEPGLAEALAKHPDAKGWIVDLRGNAGGGYSSSLIKAIRDMPRPVAVLIDAGCVSAGETLARDFARYAEARLFGTKTAGSSTAKQHWKLPSGIATIRFSVRSRWRRDRKPIEFNGIDPDVTVEADPQELAKGLNSPICRAEQYLKRMKQAEKPVGP